MKVASCLKDSVSIVKMKWLISFPPALNKTDELIITISPGNTMLPSKSTHDNASSNTVLSLIVKSSIITTAFFAYEIPLPISLQPLKVAVCSKLV